MLNWTHAEHAGIAAALQLLLWPVFGPLAAGAIAVAVFVGREIAQHEYKLALSRGWRWGQPMPVKWYEGFTTGWTTDSILDVASTIAACSAIFLASGYLSW